MFLNAFVDFLFFFGHVLLRNIIIFSKHNIFGNVCLLILKLFCKKPRLLMSNWRGVLKWSLLKNIGIDVSVERVLWWFSPQNSCEWMQLVIYWKIGPIIGGLNLKTRRLGQIVNVSLAFLVFLSKKKIVIHIRVASIESKSEDC